MLSLLTTILSLQKQFLACYWALIKAECLIYGTPCDYQTQVFIINWVLSDLQNHETGFSRLHLIRNFPRGPVVKNLPCKAGDVGSIPGWRMKIPQASVQPSLHATATEPMLHNLRVHVSEPKVLHDATKIPCTATETWGSQINKRNWSAISDTGPKLIQKAQINYMSRWFRFPWRQFLQFHLSLYSKAPRGGGERTGLISGRLCTSKPATARSGRLLRTAQFRAGPEKRWWRKTVPVGRALGNTHVIHLCGRKEGLRCQFIWTRAISDGLAICRDLKRTHLGNRWHDGLWKRSVDGFFLSSSIRQQTISWGFFFVRVLLN